MSLGQQQSDFITVNQTQAIFMELWNINDLIH